MRAEPAARTLLRTFAGYQRVKLGSTQSIVRPVSEFATSPMIIQKHRNPAPWSPVDQDKQLPRGSRRRHSALSWVLIMSVAASFVSELGDAMAQAANPSFDCAKARTQDEIVICNDSRLAELDQAIAIGLSQISGDHKKSAIAVAKGTVKTRRSCGSSKLCIIDQQVNAIQTLSELGSAVPIPPWVGNYRISLFRNRAKLPTNGLPQQVGQCTVTRIASISTRFGEELRRPTDELDSSGTAITYSNKGYQVSYSFVDPIATSRIGDEVLLCLMSVPENCPAGDDRGKVYSATNLRSKGVWVLPDAQHMCGGA